MLEEHTKKDIEKKSLDILRGANALDIFPTPVEKITLYTGLTIATDIDLAHVNKMFVSALTDHVKSNANRVSGSIRGLLHRPQKTIYLDQSQLPTRKSFVTVHEIAHEVLTWQHEVLSCLDDDTTLDPNVDEQFEAEANYFASTTLFQHDRFLHQIGQHEIGVQSCIKIAKHFGASLHATIRRYVEQSPKKCALLVPRKY